MLIEVNTDHNIRGTQSLIIQVKSIIQEKLEYYSNDLTRVIVSFSDLNGDKQTPVDKKCVIETRVEHRRPVAVSSESSHLLLALDEACDKMNHLLKTMMDKKRDSRPDVYAIDFLIQKKITSDLQENEEASSELQD